MDDTQTTEVPQRAPAAQTRAEILLLVILLVSAALRLSLVTWGVGLHWWDEGLHPDEPLIVNYTRDFPESFVTFTNYRYAIGYHHIVIIFNSVCRLAQDIVDGTPLTFPPLSRDQWETLFTRLLTAMLGTACVLFVYLGLRQLRAGRAAALLGAFALNLLPLHVLNSAVATTDVPMSLATIGIVLFYQRRRQEGRLADWTTALTLGVLLGVAFAIKYSAFFLLGTLGLLLLWQVAIRERRPGAFIGGQVLIVVVSVLVFAVLVPGLVFHTHQIAAGFRYESYRVYRLDMGWLDAARAFIDSWGWAGIALVVLAIVPAWRRDRTAAFELLLFVLVFVVVSKRGIISRYTLWITPLAALLVGLGVDGLLTRDVPARAALRIALAAVAVVALAITLVSIHARFWWDSRVRMGFHITEHFPPGTTVGNRQIGAFQRGQPYQQVDLPPDYPTVNGFDGPDLLIIGENYMDRVRDYWAHPEMLLPENQHWWDERELASREELQFYRDVTDGRSEYRLVTTIRPPALPVEFAGSTLHLYQREGPAIHRPNTSAYPASLEQ